MNLDEEATEECLNVDTGNPVVLQQTGSGTVHMIMHPNRGVDSDEEIDERANEEHILIDKSISLTEELITGL